MFNTTHAFVIPIQHVLYYIVILFIPWKNLYFLLSFPSQLVVTCPTHLSKLITLELI